MAEKMRKNEEYMDSVMSTMYSNWVRTVKKKEEMSVWGPIEMPVNKFTLPESMSPKKKTAQNSVETSGMCESNIIDSNTSDNNQHSSNIKFGYRKGHLDVKERLVEFSDSKLEALSNKFKIATLLLNDSIKVKCNKQEVCDVNSKADMRNNEYQDWCKNSREYSARSSSTNRVFSSKPSLPVIHSPAESRESLMPVAKHSEINNYINQSRKLQESHLKYGQNLNYKQSSRSMNNNNDDEIKSVRPKSKTENNHFEKNNTKDFKEKQENFSSYDSFKSRVYLSKDNFLLCVKITDDNNNTNFELIAESQRVSYVKKSFPKLAIYLPTIDSGCKQINYSGAVVNTILRFLFYRSSTFLKVHPITSVQVLDAAQSWNLDTFFKLFQENFLRHVLNSENASLVFFYADHYNLKEVCEACKSLEVSLTNTSAPKIRHKKCFVSISTYIEPLELCIPFEPVEKTLCLSFPKQIKNSFTFESLSGCYSIIGFQVCLNEEYFLEKSRNETVKLTVDYSLKKISDNQEKEINERIEKTLHCINTVNLRKNFDLQPKEKGQIVIEIEIEPFLCSAQKEMEILYKTSVGELRMTMKSNRKTEESNRNVLLVRKFFYHAKVPQKNSQ